jgi:hypothetical protein
VAIVFFLSSSIFFDGHPFLRIQNQISSTSVMSNAQLHREHPLTGMRLRLAKG